MKELIGYCNVDSGQLILVDPCYIDGEDEGSTLDYNYVSTAHTVGCDHTRDIVDGKHVHAVTGAALYDFGRTFHHGIGGPVYGGVVVSTGGDGSFPVYATIKDGRTTSITIEFGE